MDNKDVGDTSETRDTTRDASEAGDAASINPRIGNPEIVPPGRYLSGVRLVVACLGLAICTFLPTVEISIVSTSLVTISADLGGFDKSSWLITAYVSVFTGFLLIWAKVGHLIGLKTGLLASLVLFMAFSAGCGASTSINELIVFRALQGMSGGGMMVLPTTAFYQVVHAAHYPKMNAVSSCSVAVGLLISPAVGGALSNGNHWRWCFYLNLPAGAVCGILLAFSIPNGFPRHMDRDQEKKRIDADVVGAFLLLGTVVLLVTALEEGGSVTYAWNSALIIACFVVSGVLLGAFVAWQWWTTRSAGALRLLPMFPRSFTHNRFLHATLFGAALVGAPMTIASIELPQRYQLVNQSTPLEAGVQFLSYGALFPVGLLLASVLVGRVRVPIVHIIAAGMTFQLVGFALLSTTPDSVQMWRGQFGYSAIAGLGTGLTGGVYWLLAPISIGKEDQYLGVGAGVQARMLGGSIGVAVVNSVWINYVRTHLASRLPAAEIDSLLMNIGTLPSYPPAMQDAFRAGCSDAYNLQMRATLGFCAGHVIVLAVMWRRRPYRVSKEGTLE
ncbi:MFS general substrate transporter [Thozetella sp. PMI_491]|nr:MFS general substrate transporter [Thozetella sp. PMI_491]